jgi:hypothetical protein
VRWRTDYPGGVGSVDPLLCRVALRAILPPREGNACEPDCLYCRCHRHHRRSPVVLRIAVEKRTRPNSIAVDRETMWAVFLSCLIAVVAAALGGGTSAGHIHRAHDQRAYPTI